MAAAPSTSGGLGALPMRNDVPLKLDPAQSSKSRHPSSAPHSMRSASRGRSKTRRSRGQKQLGKGGVDLSRPPLYKGKLPFASESTLEPSPAPHINRQKTAHQVFAENPGSSGAQPQMRSWAAVAKSATKGYSLSYIPPLVVGNKLQVAISAEMLESSDPKWEECLVGYFIGKRLPFKLVEAALRHAWGPKLIDLLANDDGFYFFHIPDRELRKEIVDGGPITVAKVPLVLQQWEPLLNLEKKKHESVPIWIRLRNIPYSLWSAVGISAIASAVGKPLYVDSQTEKMKMISYARVCVEIQAGVGLPDLIEVALLDEIRTVRVEYEWRPSFCPICISFGHKCPAPKQQDPLVSTSPAQPERSPLAQPERDVSPALPPHPVAPNLGTSDGDQGEWIEVLPRKSQSKTTVAAPPTRNQRHSVTAKEPPASGQTRPQAPIPPDLVSSSISEGSPDKDHDIASEEEELSIVKSTMPEPECPPAPTRDTRRAARPTQVLGLPSSSQQDPLKNGDPSKLRCTRNRPNR